MGGDAASHGLNEVTGHHHSHVWLQGGWIYQVSRSPKSNTTPPLQLLFAAALHRLTLLEVTTQGREQKKKLQCCDFCLHLTTSSHNLTKTGEDHDEK